MLQLVIAFLPWIILAALGNRWIELALLLALAAAAATTARQFLSRSPKILDTVTVTFAFFVFAAVGVIGFGWMVLGIYMTLLVNVTLMAIAWGSLLAGTPFTIQYAREQVPQELWRAPLFIRINQFITAVWGLDFFLSALVSLYRHATGATDLASQYAWVLFSVGAALFTVYFPGWYRARALRPAGSGRASRLWTCDRYSNAGSAPRGRTAHRTSKLAKTDAGIDRRAYEVAVVTALRERDFLQGSGGRKQNASPAQMFDHRGNNGVAIDSTVLHSIDASGPQLSGRARERLENQGPASPDGFRRA